MRAVVLKTAIQPEHKTVAFADLNSIRGGLHVLIQSDLLHTLVVRADHQRRFVLNDNAAVVLLHGYGKRDRGITAVLDIRHSERGFVRLVRTRKSKDRKSPSAEHSTQDRGSTNTRHIKLQMYAGPQKDSLVVGLIANGKALLFGSAVVVAVLYVDSPERLTENRIINVVKAEGVYEIAGLYYHRA